MKLKELTGYKNLPAYQAITNLDKGKPQPGVSSYNIGKMNTVVEKLAALGWNSLGSGHYAKVFSNPTKSYVLKIFQQDYGYEKYLDIIRKNKGNPHVPILYGRGVPVQLTPKVSAIRMEKLQSVTEDIIDLYVDPEYEFEPTVEDIFSEENEMYLKKRFPDLYKLVKQISGADTDWDMHENNVMARGNVLVIIDPLS
jgi:hypothetical protein